MEGHDNKIVCKVRECAYHTTDDICTANCIEVGCTQDCCSSCDTECVTFRPAE